MYSRGEPPTPRRSESFWQTYARPVGWVIGSVGAVGLVGWLTDGNHSAAVLAAMMLAAPASIIALIVFLVRAVSQPRHVPLPPLPTMSPMPVRQGPPPGWYFDSPGIERWYDGQVFTDFKRQTPNL